MLFVWIWNFRIYRHFNRELGKYFSLNLIYTDRITQNAKCTTNVVTQWFNCQPLNATARALYFIAKYHNTIFFPFGKWSQNQKLHLFLIFVSRIEKKPQFKECLLKKSQCQNIVIFDRNGIHCACSTRFCGRAGDSEICHYNCECNSFEIFPGSSSTET